MTAVNPNQESRQNMKTLQHIRAFLIGMIEFRQNLTTHFGEDMIETYDTGRDLAHKLTFRRFDY